MASCAVLAVVLAPVAILIAWISGGRFSADTLLAAVIGGGICWLAASLALTSTYLGTRWQLPVQGVLAGMLFRLGLPLVATIALPKLGGAWAPPGVVTTILGVYLVALVVETGMALRMVPIQPRAAKSA